MIEVICHIKKVAVNNYRIVGDEIIQWLVDNATGNGIGWDYSYDTPSLQYVTFHFSSVDGDSELENKISSWFKLKYG